jgi:fructuronate reductase/mannitol 2-dehydrogenase
VTQLVPSRDLPDSTPLRDDTLADLSAAADVPTYDRTELTPSIVHIGVGGFHRAHQAVYFDDLVRRGISTDWGVVGVGLHSPQMGQVLREQDNLYTVVVRGPETDEVRVVGVLTDYLFAPADPGAVLDTLANERTRLVTLTITGSGYPTGGDPDPQDPDVVADVERPSQPGTAFGYIVEGLDRRRRAGLAPFTVLSCDNMQNNGATTRAVVVGTARLRDPELADWIEEQVAFPSSMVDRITPETTDDVRETVVRELGLEDQWPVVTEPFSQWIVEDSFCNGRPPLEQVGVQFVPKVVPYEVMKTRMLNGAHCALGYLGHLAGYGTSDEAMADPLVRDVIAGYLQEASALLLAVPGIDLEDYRQTLMERFSNPRISDQLARLCRRGSTKVPAYVLPSLRQALDQDQPRDHLVLALACWMRFLRGEDHEGAPFEIEDDLADRLRPLAVSGGTDPRPLLSEQDVFGCLSNDVRLAAELEHALQLLERGPRHAAAAVARTAVAASETGEEDTCVA